jgi:hypothetical protein
VCDLASELFDEFLCSAFVADHNSKNLERLKGESGNRVNSVTYIHDDNSVVEIIGHCKKQQRRCEIHNVAAKSQRIFSVAAISILPTH